MAVMTTALTEMINNGTSRTYRTAAHTVAAPRLVIQKVKFPPTPTGVAEDSIRIVFGTVDAQGAPNTSKISMEVTIRRPADANADHVSAAKALLRDFVASDQLDNVVNSQKWL